LKGDATFSVVVASLVFITSSVVVVVSRCVAVEVSYLSEFVEAPWVSLLPNLLARVVSEEDGKVVNLTVVKGRVVVSAVVVCFLSSVFLDFSVVFFCRR